MAPIERHLFAAGHTARGYVEWLDSVVQGVERLFVLIGTPGSGKSTLIQSIGEHMREHGYDVEWIHSPLSPETVDGVLFPQLRAGIVDGAHPRRITPQAPYVVERYLDLSASCRTHLLEPQRESIKRTIQTIKAAYERAYAAFTEALAVHDEWERFYIDNLLKDQAEATTRELAALLFGGATLNKPSFVRHMNFGAATPAGAVDFIPNLTAAASKRYFIKGRPGSGKSTMLKKLAREAVDRGFDVEVYHCGFDPNSLDMLILPECGVAIFDSTAPHEYFPDRPSDEIVDMYERIIRPGTDEAHAGELAAVKERYSAIMKQATEHLGYVKELRDQLVSIYAAAADYESLETVKAKICNELTD